MMKLSTAIGVLNLDVYCVVHYFKQEGVKTCFNCINGNTNLIQHRFIKSFVFQLCRISHSEKIKVVSIEHLKQKLSLGNN